MTAAWLVLAAMTDPALAGEARAVKRDLAVEAERFADPVPGVEAASATSVEGVGEGSVDAYVALALSDSPEVRAAFERWRGAVHRIARARTLPEPTLQLGVFVRSVETRVGPQQARISVAQAFPWPVKLTAGGEAAAAEARAAQQRLEATALAIAARVEVEYWTLWEVRATRALHRDHLELLGSLAASVRSRVETSQATLADLQQVDLARARLEDRIASLDVAERRTAADLRAATGARDLEALPTSGEPTARMPAEPVDALEQAVLAHPGVEGIGWEVEAAEARARSLGANRMPSLTVGADWVVTGPAVMPDTVDSGKDAVMAGVGVKVPLWQASYGEDVKAARADADARRADQRSRADRALAALDAALAGVDDSGRRVQTVSRTLLPQADASYASLLGVYASGQSGVAQILLSQRDLLDLGIELARARADHQRAWARLDEICGREVTRAERTTPEETP